MSKKVSMQTIADKLNVSKVTVSKALNNKGDISLQMRQKVLDMAAELGYDGRAQKDSVAYKSFVFLVLACFFEKTGERFYTRIFFHLNRICQQNGNILRLVIVSNAEYSDNVIPVLLDKNVEGVFFCGEFKDEYIKKVMKITENAVAIDFKPRNILMDSIVSNNFDLGFEAADYLIKNGHKNIGFVGSPNKSLSVCDRYFGYRKALFLSNLPFYKDYVINNENMMADTYAADINLPEIEPSAYVCNCDAAAYYFAQALLAKGRKVGEDVSLISFDNTEISELMTPGLTTMDIDKLWFAEKAFKTMKKRISGRASAFIKQYSLFSLIERNSVKNLNG